ncbi:MAG: hemerythrin domain-containing protein [Methylotenera sp.]|nr:hemerythrin domain-containing protein [Oligoflexia bacterium]
MLTQMFTRIPVLLKSVSKRKLDATEQLQMDHMKVELLFGQVKLVRDSKLRGKIIQKIVFELETHARIEEEIFYPACEKIAELKAIINESYEEHKQIKNLLNDLSRSSMSSDKIEAKLTVLIEDVMHHVRAEENELFPKVRKAMSQNKLDKLGGQLRTAKLEENRKAA